MGTFNSEDIERRARSAFNDQFQYVRALIEAREQLIAAEERDAKAYAAALANGWTKQQLDSFGISETPKRRRVRSRRAATANSGAQGGPVEGSVAPSP